MIRIAICDDEKDILKELDRKISDAFLAEEVSIEITLFEQTEQLWIAWKKSPFDVLFLDIEMPGMDGIEFGRFLQAQNLYPCILYVSGREDRVYDAFSAAPLRFLRKNYLEEELGEAVQAILHHLSRNQQRQLVLQDKGSIITIRVNDILYVECLAKKQYIATVSRLYEVKYTLAKLGEKLENCGFLQPHKGYMVNFRFISEIESTSIRLKNGTSIPLSRHRRNEVKQQYLRLVSDHLSILPQTGKVSSH